MWVQIQVNGHSVSVGFYLIKKIFLFEPQDYCRKEIMRKNIPNSVVIPSAVSSSKGSAPLYTPDGKSGMASLYPRGDSYFQESALKCMEVPTLTISDFVQESEIERVDFMKMDIEGHELKALQGASECFKNGVIRALSFEFGSGNVNSRTFFRDFWDLLHPLGYRIFRILPSSRLMHIKEYYEDCEYFRGATNYLAILP